jgi:dipeptidyl aminopeptidase/acylaminoacyl peptidase
MTRFQTIILAAALSFAAAAAAAAAAVADAATPGVATPRRPLSPEDFYRIQAVGSPEVSPDGKWVAYAVSVNDKEANESRTQIYMVSWDGKERIALTNPARGTHTPKFSPDGKYLSFIATPAGASHAQLMVLDRRGGEPRALTSTADSIGEYAWSPDGHKLLLVMEASGEEAPKPGAAPTPKPVVIDSLHFKQDIDGYLGNDHGQHLYLLDVESKNLDPLTNDSAFNEDSPAFSPDGRSVAFIRTHEKGPDPDGMYDLDVMTLGPPDMPGAAAPRTIARIYRAGSQLLAWSPDGSGIAYFEGLEPKYEAYAQSRLMLVPAAGGKPRNLSASLDRAVSSFVFAADSTSMQVTVEDDGASYVANVDLRDASIRPIARGRFVATNLASGGGHIALQYSDPTSLREIYALDGGQLRKLSAHNEDFLKEVVVGATQDLRFKSQGGTEVHGYAVMPPNAVAGRRYPTILWIHGGPNGQDDDSLAGGQYQRHLLAGGGYVVVGINYRGSSGRGSVYAKAILADWGHKEVEDILAAADHVVAIGLADPKRLGIGGWSYGGILTDYTIATDGRFKVAFSGAGSANQLSMYGSDQYILQYNNELGPPWKSEALWLKLSYPFFHADRIHTPTMFMGGLMDFNVPVAGGEQMYQALRTMGVPTELVVYPGEHHGFTKPSFLKDRAERMAAWYDHYLQ